VRRADELPTVGIGAAGSRQPGAGGGITSVYTAGLSVTAYELDFFGRVRSLSQAALAQYLGTEEARKNVQIALISSVANTYLNLLADDELLAVTRKTLLTARNRSNSRSSSSTPVPLPNSTTARPNRCSKARAPAWPS